MIADSTSATIATAVVAVVAYIAVLWIALAFYVVRDARRRSASPFFVLFAALLGFMPPFLGATVYMVIRPPRTLEEHRALELEEQAFLDPTYDAAATKPCPTCGRDIEVEFIMCPYCRTQFARRCVSCDRSLRLGWSVCPYCATDVGAPSLTRTGH